VSILISDVICSDCKGPVTLFGIPDKVWAGLGLRAEWLCLQCVGARLAVSLGDAEILDAWRADVAAGSIDQAELRELVNTLIVGQRKKFKLKRFNRYCGSKMESILVAVAIPGEGIGTSLKAHEVMGLPDVDGKFSELQNGMSATVEPVIESQAAGKLGPVRGK
jgi:hypothetical protein